MLYLRSRDARNEFHMSMDQVRALRVDILVSVAPVLSPTLSLIDPVGAEGSFQVDLDPFGSPS